MDKKSAQASALEAKLETVLPKEAAEKSQHAAAKEAFEKALQKTNAQLEAEGAEEEKVVIEPVKKQAEIKPTPKKTEPDPAKLELERLKRELAEAKAKIQEQPKKEERKAPSDFEAVQAELAEQFGEDEGKILSDALKRIIEPREQRLAQIEDLLKRAMEKSSAHAAKANRQRLSKDYPHLEDGDEAWGIIEKQAQSLFSEGKYDTSEEAFDAVAKALYGEAQKRAEIAAEEEASRIAASTPTQPSSAKRERKLTMEQKSKEVFMHLFKNQEDLSGAKKLAHQLRID